MLVGCLDSVVCLPVVAYQRMVDIPVNASKGTGTSMRGVPVVFDKTSFQSSLSMYFQNGGQRRDILRTSASFSGIFQL